MSTPPRRSKASSANASPHSEESNGHSPKRPKKATLKLLTPRTRLRVKPANKLFRVLMATQVPFPTAESKNTMALEALANGKPDKASDREMKLMKKDLEYADNIMSIVCMYFFEMIHLILLFQITRGTSQLRGEIKTKCANAIGGHYQIPGGREDSDVKKLIEWLLNDSNFAFGGLNLEVNIILHLI